MDLPPEATVQPFTICTLLLGELSQLFPRSPAGRLARGRTAEARNSEPRNLGYSVRDWNTERRSDQGLPRGGWGLREPWCSTWGWGKSPLLPLNQTPLATCT